MPKMKHRAGFTLLELLTVMLIMFVLMGMGTVAMRGIVRGTGISGAINNVKSVLTQARQYAVTRQKRTYVIFDRNGEKNSMTACARYAESAISHGSTVITDTPLPWGTNEMSLVSGTVFNLDTGRSGVVTEHNKVPYQGVSVDQIIAGVSWQTGDEVGFEVAEKRFLPSGIKFDSIDDGDTYVVIFNPDGTTEKMSGNYLIDLKEMYVAGAVPITIEVNGLTGWVRVVP